MTQKDKLLERFLEKPKGFTFQELENLLRGLGYQAVRCGKTGGSRVAFRARGTGHIIRLHRPHPGKVMKRYQIAEVISALRAKGLID